MSTRDRASDESRARQAPEQAPRIRPARPPRNHGAEGRAKEAGRQMLRRERQGRTR